MRVRFFACLAAAVIPVTTVLAEQHTAGVPALSSRPGAAYTIYVNVAGFNFDGAWYPSAGTYTPGFTASVNDVAANGTFNAAEVTQIKNIWTGIAQSYVGFDVNVTTIDPAIAGGQAGTDAQRRAFYDATPNMMHTVVGSQVRAPGTPNTTPNNKWFDDGADGVSPGIGIVSGIAGERGSHTNWMFSEAQAGAATGGVINGNYIGAVSAHENGHSFGLYHQGDYTGVNPAPVNEYSLGDAASGPGTYVPIIGQADGKQRIAWRVGQTHPNNVLTTQNDVGTQLSINTAAMATAAGRTGGADLHLVDSGIGHTLPTATPIPLFGSDVDVSSSLSKGIIVPLSESNPNPIGVSNYTQDWFSFFTDGGDAISLSLTNGTSFLVPGVADADLGAGNLRSQVSIYDALGTLIGSGTEDASTLFSSYSSLLSAGTYYAQILSFGGHEQVNAAYNPAQYFDMGAYFLTGTGFDLVPEPTSIAFLGLGMITLVRRSRTR